MAYLQVPFPTLFLWIRFLSQATLFIKSIKCSSCLTLSSKFQFSASLWIIQTNLCGYPSTVISWYYKVCLPQFPVVHSAPKCNIHRSMVCGVFLPQVFSKLLIILSAWCWVLRIWPSPMTLVWESLIHQWGEEKGIKTIHTYEFLYNATKFFCLLFSSDSHLYLIKITVCMKLANHSSITTLE